MVVVFCDEHYKSGVSIMKDNEIEIRVAYLRKRNAKDPYMHIKRVKEMELSHRCSANQIDDIPISTHPSTSII